MDSKINLPKKRLALGQELQVALKTAKITSISSEQIISLIHTAGTNWGDSAHQEFQKVVLGHLNRVKNPDEMFKVLQLVFECWNFFPHQDMKNRCPYELAQEYATSNPSTEKVEPQIKVGNQTFTLTEFEARNKHIEKEQVPFREWLIMVILPAYKIFLTDNYKPKTADKHYIIAEILCDRLLYVGFTSPLHLRAEFLYDEFPVWWQTHVAFGNYKETTIENSVMDFVNFVEAAAGVSLDTGEVATDPDNWQ